MSEYKNIMEDLVLEEFESAAQTLGCCTCEDCRNDIIAYALNQLPPKYVATRTGEVYSKTFILRNQHYADVMAALTKGARLVADHPRHRDQPKEEAQEAAEE